MAWRSGGGPGADEVDAGTQVRLLPGQRQGGGRLVLFDKDAAEEYPLSYVVSGRDLARW